MRPFNSIGGRSFLFKAFSLPSSTTSPSANTQQSIALFTTSQLQQSDDNASKSSTSSSLSVPSNLLMRLRKESQASMLKCKNALVQSNLDYSAALQLVTAQQLTSKAATQCTSSADSMQTNSSSPLNHGCKCSTHIVIPLSSSSESSSKNDYSAVDACMIVELGAQSDFVLRNDLFQATIRANLTEWINKNQTIIDSGEKKGGFSCADLLQRDLMSKLALLSGKMGESVRILSAIIIQPSHTASRVTNEDLSNNCSAVTAVYVHQPIAKMTGSKLCAVVLSSDGLRPTLLSSSQLQSQQKSSTEQSPLGPSSKSSVNRDALHRLGIRLGQQIMACQPNSLSELAKQPWLFMNDLKTYPLQERQPDMNEEVSVAEYLTGDSENDLKGIIQRVILKSSMAPSIELAMC